MYATTSSVDIKDRLIYRFVSENYYIIAQCDNILNKKLYINSTYDIK